MVNRKAKVEKVRACSTWATHRLPACTQPQPSPNSIHLSFGRYLAFCWSISHPSTTYIWWTDGFLEVVVSFHFENFYFDILSLLLLLLLLFWLWYFDSSYFIHYDALISNTRPTGVIEKIVRRSIYITIGYWWFISRSQISFYWSK